MTDEMAAMMTALMNGNGSGLSKDQMKMELLKSFLSQNQTGFDGDEDPQTYDGDPEIQQTLEDLLEFSHTLALGLGACPECWGEDRHCPECKGYGRAGFFVPNQEIYHQLVDPAVQKMRAAETVLEGETVDPAPKQPQPKGA